jgi:methylenetetrahydrofolate reductase (NADPH)
MRTSLEIVPNDLDTLDAAARLIATRYPRLDTVNLPDRPNSALGSIAAAAHLGGRVAHRIPHLRACDLVASSVAALTEALVAAGVDEVVVVAGDQREPRGGMQPAQLIARLKRAAPSLTIYAALDPHRYRDDAALAHNVDAKRAAGADGFFTQPLFDLRDLDRCAPLLDGAIIFWGVSPVVSDRSARYWQRVNGVEFPDEFAPTLSWSHAFALRFLSEVADRGGNAYLMPIRVDLERYLEPLQARLAAR